ncbi:MAG: PP2C family protein-serine/threonine phosphatase [Spirochaetaceae bacterium]|jgi:sigma-B regulation protein RsbU (phosphoserine phosphatase)|nr:PP2C family protein-serine/threonine phosphatase [Spirochaetaceae bacterium]
MTASEQAEFQKIRILLNHINGYSDIIRTDALLMKKDQLAEYFGQILSECAEIKHIMYVLSGGKDNENFLTPVMREEIARHLYIIMHLFIRLQNDIPVEDYTCFESETKIIKNALTELVLFFEKMLDITPEIFDGMPVSDPMGMAAGPELSEYLLGITEAIPEIDIGNILLIGNSPVIVLLEELFSERGYKLYNIEKDDDIRTSLIVYDISFICIEADKDAETIMSFIVSLKHDPLFHDIPIICCAQQVDKAVRIRFIEEAGIIDYVTSQSDMELVLAHVHAAITYFHGNYRRQLYIRALEMNRYHVSKELSSAASYISKKLPPPFETPSLSINWAFLPSQELGGDIFGYTWLSETEFALFLVDVSGHGVEASFYSVIIMTLLSKKLLKKADFRNPASVLDELNQIFKLEEQNNMYFTAWYGVYSTEKRLLTYSNAGSQPAILYPPESPAEKLTTDGLVVGVDASIPYENGIRFIAPGSRLHVFSDGIFEIRKKDGKMMALGEFIELLGTRKPQTESCREFVNRVEAMSKNGQFDDDVSMIELSFSD